MKKTICMIILLLFAFLLLSGCNQSNEARVTHAKIRYFDGSCDTLEIEKWFASASGTVTLHTDTGRKIVIGANNVIIIEESKDQYENREEDWP